MTKILGSLDASSRKYWTLTKNKALLFVKDVTETNRYKGLTSNTFFSGDSANDFLQNLAVNKVSHKIIQMGDDRYVASGVIFGYNGARYTICLLTNDTVILDNNSFMASKIGLSVFVNGILIVLLLSTMVFSILSDIRKNKLAKMKAHTEELNRIVERQNRNDQGDGSLSYPVECVPYPADGCVCPKIRTEKSDANYTCTAFICFGSCEKTVFRTGTGAVG